MLLIALASAALASGAPDDAYAYHDHRSDVRLRMWTVGTSAASRPSTEVCRWSAEVRRGGRYHTIEGSRAGNCHFVRKLVEKERAKKLAALEARLGALAAN